MRAGALILAAGRGDRLGAGVPKAAVRIGGRSVLAHSAHALGSSPCVAAILPVIAAGEEAAVEELRRAWRAPASLLEPVAGGATRQASVARGLAALERQAPDLDWVLVHDAARCLVVPEDAVQVLVAAQSSGAAIPVLPVTDTLKELDADAVVATPARSRFGRALTPQAFRIDLLRRALELADRDGFEGTDCASLVERLGVTVRVCAGREENIKLTTPADLARVRSVLEDRRSPTNEREETGKMTAFRIGQGFDVHRFAEGRPLVLAGLEIAHSRGLDGHSDADAVAHAVADALLGALGAGDLGVYYPSSDPKWRGASGAVLLAPILERVAEAGWRIANVDTTIIAQEPRLAPYAAKLRGSLAGLLRLEEARVNVKLKSTDRLGAIGRSEGIAAQAIVLLEGEGP